MGRKKMLPIGIEDFEEIRKKDFYYVDKTGMIREILESQSKVTLFPRPRRFGKSLNMSMLAHFFSPDRDKHIFDGLEISKETALCEKYMGKYPVIFVSLKNVEGQDFNEASAIMRWVIGTEALRLRFLAESDALSAEEKEMYLQLIRVDASGHSMFTMSDDVLSLSLHTLCRLLEKHFGSKVVLLIDEYDVPLASAHINGYYDRMVSLMRSLLGAALKTNVSLEFAVLTGCLRVSKESIFTGLNNLKVRSITDRRSAKYFGFTDDEVKNLLSCYGYTDSYDTAKRWYDGYRFGDANIYCPWDVLNYCDSLLDNPKAQPGNYWINTSGNDAVKRFIEMADDTTRQEIEALVAGETIAKEIREDLTYQDMYSNIDNLWSLLFMTGYLTSQGMTNEGLLILKIPNMEVRDVFVKQIREYFKDSVRADTETLNAFCAALRRGDADSVEQIFSQYLERTISIRDTASRDDMKENFYHGVLLGIMGVSGLLSVISNREAGNGYADITAKSKDGHTGIVIEVKYASDGDLETACYAALTQIEETGYADAFKYTRVKTIHKYGIACYKKCCRVMLG